MANNGDGRFKDFLWRSDHRFDPGDVALSSGATAVYYLHGGLHLYHVGETGTAKRVSPVRNLLDAATYERAQQAQFVSEGTASEKRVMIERSDYLRFAYGRLLSNSDPIVVFGHSLDVDQDRHIIEALNAHERRVAVSVRPPAKLYMWRVRAALDNDVTFFDSRTHPLGDVSLQCC
jgi:hypothetical protein